jgi:HAE1 family hydrophobic/amphiphilic exporter-1
MSKFFIRRPIVAIVIAIVTVILGVVSLVSLPTAQYPDIVPPEILVTATYPGADSKTVSQSVSTPIEQQMNGVDNMIYMDSVSANNGVVQLFVDFDVKTDPNIDQVLAQLRVDQAQSQLPAQVTTAGLTVQKALTSPLMLVAVNSPTPSSTCRTSSPASKVCRACRCLADSMPCAFGCTPTRWPSWASPRRTSSRLSRPRTT